MKKLVITCSTNDTVKDVLAIDGTIAFIAGMNNGYKVKSEMNAAEYHVYLEFDIETDVPKFLQQLADAITKMKVGMTSLKASARL